MDRACGYNNETSITSEKLRVHTLERCAPSSMVYFRNNFHEFCRYLVLHFVAIRFLHFFPAVFVVFENQPGLFPSVNCSKMVLIVVIVKTLKCVCSL